MTPNNDPNNDPTTPASRGKSMPPGLMLKQWGANGWLAVLKSTRESASDETSCRLAWEFVDAINADARRTGIVEAIDHLVTAGLVDRDKADTLRRELIARTCTAGTEICDPPPWAGPLPEGLGFLNTTHGTTTAIIASANKPPEASRNAALAWVKEREQKAFEAGRREGLHEARPTAFSTLLTTECRRGRTFITVRIGADGRPSHDVEPKDPPAPPPSVRRDDFEQDPGHVFDLLRKHSGINLTNNDGRVVAHLSIPGPWTDFDDPDNE